MATLRSNLSHPRTRWTTIATLLSAMVALVGSSLSFIAIVAYSAQSAPSSLVLEIGGGTVVFGVALTTLFSRLLSSRKRRA